MTDIQFNPTTNDIDFIGGEAAMIYGCSGQNAALIFNKSAASITQPQFGVGFEEFYPNLPRFTWGRVETVGERQIKRDGALLTRIRIVPDEDGKVQNVEIIARYRE